jgi:hypothetical protein
MTEHQLFMLRMFEKGWGFKLFNERPSSWITYWSLKRRKLIETSEYKKHKGKPVVMIKLTEKGIEMLKRNKNAK